MVQKFTEAHPVLKDVHTFEFEPFGQDQVRCFQVPCKSPASGVGGIFRTLLWKSKIEDINLNIN